MDFPELKNLPPYVEDMYSMLQEHAGEVQDEAKIELVFLFRLVESLQATRDVLEGLIERKLMDNDIPLP